MSFFPSAAKADMLNLTTSAMSITGFFGGFFLLFPVFAFAIGNIIKIPGAHAIRYWALGSVSTLVMTVVAVTFRNNTNFFLGMLIFAMFMVTYLMTYLGFQIIAEKKPNRRMVALIGGGAMLIYAILLLNNNTWQQRLSAFSLFPLVVWPLIVREAYRCWPGRYMKPKAAILTGAILMNIASLGRLYLLLFAGQNTPAIIPYGSAEFGKMALVFSGSFIGGTFFCFGTTFLFFMRVLDHTNHTASHDELTGLLNRRAIIEVGEREIELACRSGLPLTITFMDVDHFKKVNDVYGHDKGDLVLREIAQVLTENCRRVDLLGRYGGEEFCLIFPGDDHEGAKQIGERLICAVRAHHFEGVPGVTISAGMAVMPANQSSGTNWHELVARADSELYRAKHSGRDRYCIEEQAAIASEPQQQNLMPARQQES